MRIYKDWRGGGDIEEVSRLAGLTRIEEVDAYVCWYKIEVKSVLLEKDDNLERNRRIYR